MGSRQLIPGLPMRRAVSNRAPFSPLSDTFTDTNGTALASHTMTSGPGWTQHTGTATIQSNKLESGTSGTAALASANAAQSDRCAAIDVTVPGSGQFCAGVAFRITDANNGYLLLLTNDDGSTTYLTLVQLAGVL